MRIGCAVSVVLAALLGGSPAAEACTHITLSARDGGVVVGRTMEVGADLESRVLTAAKGTRFQSPSPSGASGMAWTAKYGYVKLDFLGTGRAVDGINSEGLSIGLLYLPGYTEYQEVPAGHESAALEYLFVGDWVLGSCASTPEVKSAIENVFVYGQPKTFGTRKHVLFPIHLIVVDSEGRSAVVEWVNGEVNVYDNPNGLLTNSPEYPWQLTNLKNYVNLSPFSPVPTELHGMEYAGTGQGSGAIGLPGDFTPPSRFVKMTFLVETSQPVATADAALIEAQHILNNVDIPVGAVRGTKADGDEQPDRTQWTVFKDLRNLKLYFKSYTNSSLQVISLASLDLSPGSPERAMPVESKQTVVDVTGQLLVRETGAP